MSSSLIGSWDGLSGDWQGLDAPNHERRYRTLARYIHGSGAKVLDIGCGAGQMRGFLPDGIEYTGIEPSRQAVDQALSRGVHALHTTSEQFSPPDWYDYVIFNEVLYYMEDPIGQLTKYAHTLGCEGRIVISIFQKQGRPSPKAIYQWYFGGRKPFSNAHCTRVVQAFLKKNRWNIRHSEAITSEKKKYQVLVVSPP